MAEPVGRPTFGGTVRTPARVQRVRDVTPPRTTKSVLYDMAAQRLQGK
jgi:hypothetical protein